MHRQRRGGGRQRLRQGCFGRCRSKRRAPWQHRQQHNACCHRPRPAPLAPVRAHLPRAVGLHAPDARRPLHPDVHSHGTGLGGGVALRQQQGASGIGGVPCGPVLSGQQAAQGSTPLLPLPSLSLLGCSSSSCISSSSTHLHQDVARQQPHLGLVLGPAACSWRNESVGRRWAAAQSRQGRRWRCQRCQKCSRSAAPLPLRCSHPPGPHP